METLPLFTMSIPREAANRLPVRWAHCPALPDSRAARRASAVRADVALRPDRADPVGLGGAPLAPDGDGGAGTRAFPTPDGDGGARPGVPTGVPASGGGIAAPKEPDLLPPCGVPRPDGIPPGIGGGGGWPFALRSLASCSARVPVSECTDRKLPVGEGGWPWLGLP